MKAAFLFLLLAPGAALAVAPATPHECQMVAKSQLGEHLRETAWDVTRARTKLNRDLSEHNRRCAAALTGLEHTHELTELERIASDTRRVNAELLDVSDEYMRTLLTASKAAHLLGEQGCEHRLLQQRHDVEEQLNQKAKEVASVLEKYCR